MQSNRLFVALDLDKAHRKAIAKYRGQHGRIPYLRFVHPNNFHITALFIGDVPEAAQSDLRAALADIAAGQERFELTLQNVIYAPPHKPTKMVWARYADSQEYAALCDRLYQALAFLSPQEPKHTPHVTLARFKERAHPRALVKLATPNRLEPLAVEAMTLYSSELSPGGSLYTPLETIQFGAS